MAKRILCRFLAENSNDASALNADIGRLETRLRREPDGWMKDELRRNISAIQAFQSSFPRIRPRRARFSAGPTDVAMRVEGVNINVRLDLEISERSRLDVTYSGGVVLFIANTDQARKNIEGRRRVVAALIHWVLQNNSDNIEPIERLCLSFDVFGQIATPAPTATERLRLNVRSSCLEAAAGWNGVEPPEGYDGPDWH